MQPMRDINAIQLEAQSVFQHLLGMIDLSFMHEIQLHALNEMIRLTESQTGFLSLVDQDEGLIRLHLMSAAGQPPHPVFNSDGVDLNQEGYWTACMASRMPVIRNDSLHSSVPSGSPYGLTKRDLMVPVLEENKIVAIFGVGNRPVDYESFDAELLGEMAKNLWRVVIRKRLLNDLPDDFV